MYTTLYRTHTLSACGVDARKWPRACKRPQTTYARNAGRCNLSPTAGFSSARAPLTHHAPISVNIYTCVYMAYTYITHGASHSLCVCAIPRMNHVFRLNVRERAPDLKGILVCSVHGVCVCEGLSHGHGTRFPSKSKRKTNFTLCVCVYVKCAHAWPVQRYAAVLSPEPGGTQR